MKALKGFLPTLYSEYLLIAPAATAAGQAADHLVLGTELGEKGAAGEDEGDLLGRRFPGHEV